MGWLPAWVVRIPLVLHFIFSPPKLRIAELSLGEDFRVTAAASTRGPNQSANTTNRAEFIDPSPIIDLARAPVNECLDPAPSFTWGERTMMRSAALTRRSRPGSSGTVRSGGCPSV